MRSIQTRKIHRFFTVCALAFAGLVPLQADERSDSPDPQQADLEADPSTIGDTTSKIPMTDADVGASSLHGTDLSDIDGSESVFRGKDLRELISLNEPVQAALNDWLTYMRPTLMEAYENYQYLRGKVAPIYQEAELPEALLFAIVATETGGKVHAYSRAGAAGLLQFMRQTGRRYGLTVKNGFDMRLDPVASTKANVSYLNEQLGELDYSLEKTLAAYNGGENRIRRLDRRLKGVDFWDSKFYNSLPRETREYVPRILAAAWLFLHPEDYNLQFPQYHIDTTTLTVRRDTSLDELCVCFGQEQDKVDGWFRVLRNLNPRLNPEDLIEAGDNIEIPSILTEAYERNCLEGELLKRARQLHDARYPEMTIYTVVAGDTLGKIAARNRCTTQSELATINNLRAPRYLIRIGQHLKIPGCR
jgi:membrane-bound lytic murein transglycosylase D